MVSPEETNAAYGIAKKALLIMLQAYRQQYGLNSIYLLPTNLYGPGDNFNLDSGHVIPCLIKKIAQAKQEKLDHIDVWGTGAASREFLYVEDCVRAIRLAMEKYDGVEPVNIGSGQEVTIKRLTEIIANLMNYDGNIIWDTTKPDGQPRRCLDVSKAKQYFDFESITNIVEGLKKTIDWFYKEKLHVNAP
jgi:GDP-L-fucose synthase